jgi:hypothetical protein
MQMGKTKVHTSTSDLVEKYQSPSQQTIADSTINLPWVDDLNPKNVESEFEKGIRCRQTKSRGELRVVPMISLI